jgi:ABC-type glycerol-3-phosphate transport system substrate-binding protein
MGNELNRRSFLNAAVSAAGLVAMGPLLSACGGGGPQRAGVNSESGLKAVLPAYVPNTSIKPDIPSVAGGPDVLTDPGFLGYPANRVATVSGVPGKGGRYSAVTPLWGTIPPADNSFYQAMNKALGVTLDMKPADGNNYNTIIPTMTAAKKLPDWINLPGWWNPAFNTAGLVGNQLADLTPYLSGDNIKKYPNLAAIPTAAWRAGAWGDKLYGIPSFATGCGVAGAIMYRRDVFDAKGITADQVKSADDLMNLGKELTDAKGGVWAFDDVYRYFYTAFGAPLKWKVDNGKLIHLFETQEFLDAADWHRKLAVAGYIHPDALAGDNAGGNTRFYGGKTLISGGGLGVWNLADLQSGQAANPNFRRGAFNFFAADGKSAPRVDLNPATNIVSYLNANLKPEQIEELLSVANYLAAPFGSAEYTMVNFGVEGTHFTMKDGVPTPTEAGQKEVQAKTYPFLASAPAAINNPNGDIVTKDLAAWQAANVKAMTKPVFWSMNISMPSAQATAEAAQPVEDTLKDVIHGKKSIEDLKNSVANWKSSGGGDRLIQWMNDNVLQKHGTGQ